MRQPKPAKCHKKINLNLDTFRISYSIRFACQGMIIAYDGTGKVTKLVASQKCFRREISLNQSMKKHIRSRYLLLYNINVLLDHFRMFQMQFPVSQPCREDFLSFRRGIKVIFVISFTIFHRLSFILHSIAVYLPTFFFRQLFWFLIHAKVSQV